MSIKRRMVCPVLNYVIPESTSPQHSRFIRETFQHYVSPTVVDEMIRSNQRPQLGGQTRELTIFFSDVAGFTSISERLKPTELVSLLNRYLGEITSVLLNYEGTFDKFIGDAVVAFWNAPLDIPDHPIKAVSAAITAMEKIDLLQPFFEEKYKTNLHTRVGIATGEVVVGNFGAEGRKVVNYSIMGDSANFAARLEGANKYFGTQILVSAEVYNRSIGAIPYRRIGLLRVVGKENEICIYEPLQRSIYTGSTSKS